MNSITLLTTALRALTKHTIRTLLTIISIIVGIAAIIATLAIGYGAEEKMKRKIEALGKNYIFIHSGSRHQTGKTKTKTPKSIIHLSLQEVHALQQEIPHIKAISGIIWRQKVSKYAANSVSTYIQGCNEHALAIIGRKIKSGIFFSSSHVWQKANVAVLGSKAAKELFGNLPAVGKFISIERNKFHVIGVLQEEKDFLGTDDPNLTIFIPLTTMQKLYAKKDNLYVDGIAASLQSAEMMPEVVRRMRKSIRYMHRLKNEDSDDFTIYDQQSMAKAAQAASAILTMVLLIIASISLLVGGIGIMNIMLVSVTERQREIGIRMALGATSSLILKQFVFESLTLCFIGGVMGTILGVAASCLISCFTGMVVIFKLHVILLAFMVTIFIGIFFGLYPAYKASRLNPVEALAER